MRGPQKLTAQFGDEQCWTPSFGLGAFFTLKEGGRGRERKVCREGEST